MKKLIAFSLAFILTSNAWGMKRSYAEMNSNTDAIKFNQAIEYYYAGKLNEAEDIIKEQLIDNAATKDEGQVLAALINLHRGIGMDEAMPAWSDSDSKWTPREFLEESLDDVTNMRIKRQGLKALIEDHRAQAEKHNRQANALEKQLQELNHPLQKQPKLNQ